jgi:serine/threonine-protein kinase
MKSCPQCSATFPDDYAVCPKDGAALQDTSVWQVNTVIRGRYKILALIGEGGMATVYKAHHQLLDELRALKVIKPELARDPSFVQRFKNEAIITRKLQHPNAVRVDDLDIAEDGRPFISMEFVEGESLKSLIQRTGPLGTARTLDLALQVCQALDAAHTLGLIHRDIKPDNIYILSPALDRRSSPRRETSLFAKVLDFGIARLKEEAPGGGESRGMTLTGTGVVIGTPDYMSPEQALGKHGEQLDGRSDLYSLGIVMYRMLTGVLPFKADTTVEMILHHIQTIPEPPQSRVRGTEVRIPDDVSAIVMRALEKDREKRFPSAGAMAEAIRQARQALAPSPALHGATAGGEAPTIARAPGAGAEPRPRAPAESAPARGIELTELAPRPGVAPALQSRTAAGTSPGPSLRQPLATPAPAPPRPPLSKPAGIRPATPVALQKKGFPTATIVAGVAALVVVLLGLAALKWRWATGGEPAATTIRQAQEEPTPPSSPQTASASAGPAAAPKQQVQQNTPLAANPKEQRGPKTATPGPTPQRHGATPLPSTSLREAEQGRSLTVPEQSRREEPFSPADSNRAESGNKKAEGAGDREVRQMVQNAQVFFEAGDYPGAARVAHHALQLAPNNEGAKRVFVKSLQKQGQRLYDATQYRRAAMVFRRILEVDPNNVAAQESLKQCQAALREHSE